MKVHAAPHDFRQDPAHTKRLVDAVFIDLVAEALYRFDRRDPTVELKQLDQTSQDKYVADAMVMAYMRDPKKVMPAMYFAADGVTNDGIGSCSRALRVHIVGILELAFSRFRKALSDQEPAGVATMQKLVEADGEEARRLAETTTSPIASEDLGDAAPGRLM